MDGLDLKSKFELTQVILLQWELLNRRKRSLITLSVTITSCTNQITSFWLYKDFFFSLFTSFVRLMETGRSLLSTPFPPSKPRNHLRNQMPISGTPKILHSSSLWSDLSPISFFKLIFFCFHVVGNFPRSVITQESCETYKGYYLSKEETFKLVNANLKILVIYFWFSCYTFWVCKVQLIFSV